MPNTAEYKNYLFVQVPKDAKWLGVDYNKKHLYYSTEQDRDLLIILPPGSWQIIGKGDQLSESDWEGIVERYIYSGRSSYYAYKDYSGKKPESEDDIIVEATESGHSLLRSLKMEPSETLILKKNEI